MAEGIILWHKMWERNVLLLHTLSAPPAGSAHDVEMMRAWAESYSGSTHSLLSCLTSFHCFMCQCHTLMDDHRALLRPAISVWLWILCDDSKRGCQISSQAFDFLMLLSLCDYVLTVWWLLLSCLKLRSTSNCRVSESSENEMKLWQVVFSHEPSVYSATIWHLTCTNERIDPVTEWTAMSCFFPLVFRGDDSR